MVFTPKHSFSRLPASDTPQPPQKQTSMRKVLLTFLCVLIAYLCMPHLTCLFLCFCHKFAATYMSQLKLAGLLCLVFMVVEAVGGSIANSLAILTECVRKPFAALTPPVLSACMAHDSC